MKTSKAADKGENSKLEALYKTYRKRMYFAAFKVLKDPMLAEDAVHDAFIAIARNLDKEMLLNNDGNDLFFAFYKDIDRFFSYDEALCYNTKLSSKAKKNDEFVINLSSETDEKFRISLYINNELQPVFDGCSYADVSVKKGQQTQLLLNIDTTKLKEQNEVYILFTQRDVPFELGNRSAIEQSDIYMLKLL